MSATKNIGASVRARLLNRARADKVDFNLMLTRYALERLLYRLNMSEWSNEFLLKGALLFDLWFDQPQRSTRDIDLLGFGPAGLEYLTTVFQKYLWADMRRWHGIRSGQCAVYRNSQGRQLRGRARGIKPA